MRRYRLSLVAMLALIIATVSLVGCVSASEHQTLQTQYTALQTQLSTADSQLSTTKSDLAAAKANSAKLKNDYDAIKLQYDRLTNDNAVLVDNYKKLQAKYDALAAMSLPAPTPLPSLTLSSVPSSAKYLFDSNATVLSSDRQPVPLGRISNKFDSDSILNMFGSYGSRFASNSVWNRFSNYGGQFSSLSPFNQFTSTPPRIYIGSTLWGYLSTNRFLSNNTLSPNDLLIFAYQTYNDAAYLDLMIK